MERYHECDAHGGQPKDGCGLHSHGARATQTRAEHIYAVKSAQALKGRTMKSRVVGVVAMVAVSMTNVTHAAAVPLDSTTINFSFSGSPNTIAGSWDAGGLDGGSTTVDSYLVEFIGFTSDFGPPQSVTFVSTYLGNSVGLHFCNPLSIACVTEPTPGALQMVTENNAPVDGAWTFLNRVLLGKSDTKLSGNGGASFSSGGPSATLSGQVQITAYGQAQAVPEPSTFALLTAGLLAIGFARRARTPA